MFNLEIEAYRRRRHSSTRLPLDWVNNGNSYIFNLFFAFVFPLAGGIDLLLRHHAVWQRIVGALLVSLVAVEIALFIRWSRLPIDAEAFEKRDERQAWWYGSKQRIPPRSKW